MIRSAPHRIGADTEPLDTLTDDGLLTPEVGDWSETKYRHLKNYAEMFATATKGKWGSVALHWVTGRTDCDGDGQSLSFDRIFPSPLQKGAGRMRILGVALLANFLACSYLQGQIDPTCIRSPTRRSFERAGKGELE